MAGFRAAKALGCAWVEFDVRLTADGALVLCHDSRLDRTTDRKGAVAALPLAAVQACDAGSWFDPRFAGETVPTLEAALACVRRLGLGANIEIKADRGRAAATAAAVAAVLSQLGAPPAGVLVSSFEIKALAALRRLSATIPTGLLLGRLRRDWAALAAELGCATINLDHRRVRPARVSRLAAAGYRVLAYTVNDPPRARQLFEWGVTSVFSDNPDIILASAASTRQGAVG